MALLDVKIRAFWFPPYDGAYIEKNGKKYTLVDKEILDSLVDKDTTAHYLKFINPDSNLVLGYSGSGGGMRFSNSDGNDQKIRAYYTPESSKFVSEDYATTIPFNPTTGSSISGTSSNRVDGTEQQLSNYNDLLTADFNDENQVFTFAYDDKEKITGFNERTKKSMIVDNNHALNILRSDEEFIYLQDPRYPEDTIVVNRDFFTNKTSEITSAYIEKPEKTV